MRRASGSLRLLSMAIALAIACPAMPQPSGSGRDVSSKVEVGESTRGLSPSSGSKGQVTVRRFDSGPSWPTPATSQIDETTELVDEADDLASPLPVVGIPQTRGSSRVLATGLRGGIRAAEAAGSVAARAHYRRLRC